MPFEFGHFATTVTGYLDEIQKQAERSGRVLDFNDLRSQLDTLKQNSGKYDSLLNLAMQKADLNSQKLTALNETLLRTERALTRPQGLPNREWYKHQIYAPGFYTGYGVKTLPGIREAVDSKDWSLAQKQASVVEQCLEQMNQMVSRAIQELAGS